LATNVVLVTGTTTPLQYASQRKLDRTVSFGSNVLWMCVLWDSDDTLRFYWSSNNGSTWTEDTAVRISNVDVASGADIEIDTGKGIQNECLWVTYVTLSDFKLRMRRGVFDSTPTSLRWSDVDTDGDKTRIIAEAANSLYADMAVCSGVEGVHFFYMSVATKNVYWRYTKHSATNNRSFTSGPQTLVQGGSSFNSWPTGAVRHSGNDNQFLNGDVYMAYASLSPEATESHKLVRIPAKGIGSYDGIGEKRRMASDDGVAGLISSCFDGDFYCAAVVPDAAPTTIVMHEMNAADNARQTRTPPAPGLGNIIALTVSWDYATYDPYIVAAGATTGFPWYTFFDRSAGTWASWVQINSDVVSGNSLTARPGSYKMKKIEFAYSIVSSTNRQVRFESITIGNTPPSAPMWMTLSGPIDQSIPTPLELEHFDADGDPLTAIKLRRQVNGGAIQYYTGSAWQAGETSFANTDGMFELSAANNGIDLDVTVYTAATSDGTVFGPYSEALTLVGSTPVNPVMDEPDDLDTVTAGLVTVQWTVTEQTAYRIRILTAANEELYSTGIVADTDTRELVVPFQLANSTTYKAELVTFNFEGIASAADTNQFTTSWALPATPTYVATVDADAGAVSLAVTNPGGGAAATTSNRIYRAVDAELTAPGDDLSEYRLIGVDEPVNVTYVDRSAPSGVAMRYRVVAVSATYTTALGA
jgi:hypothetical protein